jgi:hypothetical protein
MSASPDGRQSQCKTCKNVYRDGGNNGTPRSQQGKGLYLGVLKMADKGFLVKPGKTGDGNWGFRSRAGSLANTARQSGLDVVSGEIFHVIESTDPEVRTNAERVLLGIAEPVYKTEYFAGTTYREFEKVFVNLGRPYTVRTTYAARYAEFGAWLSAQEVTV